MEAVVEVVVIQNYNCYRAALDRHTKAMGVSHVLGLLTATVAGPLTPWSSVRDLFVEGLLIGREQQIRNRIAP